MNFGMTGGYDPLYLQQIPGHKDFYGGYKRWNYSLSPKHKEFLREEDTDERIWGFNLFANCLGIFILSIGLIILLWLEVFIL